MFEENNTSVNIHTFTDYKKYSTALTMNQMKYAHQEIKKGIEKIRDENEKILIKKKLLEYSWLYMQERLTASYGRESVNRRTESHKVIDDFIKGLCFNIKSMGQPTKYLEEVLDGDDKQRCGDFACYVVFMESLCSRGGRVKTDGV